MTNIEQFKNDKTPNSVAAIRAPYFPWLSIFLSLIAISFIIFYNDKNLNQFYDLSVLEMKPSFQYAIFIILGLVYLLDFRIFQKNRRRNAQLIQQLNNQLQSVSQSKKKQQQRANTFSDNSEKLKSFISDKLIDYMDFDEKLIHFKGIASEVRHNGVISYDKVTTALKKAIEQQNMLSLYEQGVRDTDEVKRSQFENVSNLDPITISALTDYQNALESMRYLWSLLDLSTADNMALHIGNQLIECEEHYFQLQLDSQRALDSTQSIPVSPTFHPQLALLLTFSLFMDRAEINRLIALSKINEKLLQDDFYFEDDLFLLEIENTGELLGNHNHVILLLENLIKNAQFFISKNRRKQKHDRIVVQLCEKNGNACFSIYNRGPLIEPEQLDNIFKLGYSTRNNKQHHGKGLGLFFSKEIVKGYQGSIKATNLENENNRYRLTLHIASSETLEYQIETRALNGKVESKLVESKQAEQADWQNVLVIQSEIPIESITLQEDLKGSSEDIQLLSGSIEQTTLFEWIDPIPNHQPKWSIEIKPYKKQHKLTFNALDMAGVKFEIELPTARSLLE